MNETQKEDLLVTLVKNYSNISDSLNTIILKIDALREDNIKLSYKIDEIENKINKTELNYQREILRLKLELMRFSLR